MGCSLSAPVSPETVAARAAQRGYVDLKALKGVELPGQKASVAPEGPESTPEWAKEGFIRVDQDSTFRGAMVSFKTSKEQSSRERGSHRSRRSSADARYVEGAPVKVSFDPSSGAVKVQPCDAHAVLNHINGGGEPTTQSGSPSPNGAKSPFARRKSFPEMRDLRSNTAPLNGEGGAVRIGSFAAPTPPKHRTPDTVTSKSAPRLRRVHSMPTDAGADICSAALAAAANAPAPASAPRRERIRTGSGSLKSSQRSNAKTTFAPAVAEAGSSRSLSSQVDLAQLRQDSFKFSGDRNREDRKRRLG